MIEVVDFLVDRDFLFDDFLVVDEVDEVDEEVGSFLFINLFRWGIYMVHESREIVDDL